MSFRTTLFFLFGPLTKQPCEGGILLPKSLLNTASAKVQTLFTRDLLLAALISPGPLATVTDRQDKAGHQSVSFHRKPSIFSSGKF